MDLLSSFACPACGPLAQSDLQLYQPELFNAHSLRFGPWCTRCGARALPLPDPPPPRAPLLLVSGSCASGKSTVSYLLAREHGFVQIDGDWVWIRRKGETGRKLDYTEVDPEMLAAASGLLAMGRPVVIAQLILPGRLPFFAAYCAAHGITWRMAVLLPRDEVLLERNRTRVCWPKPTPAYYVEKFQADLRSGPPAFTRWLDDNSAETPGETAARLAELVRADAAPNNLQASR
ncbi:MAG: AAA family ATPase [Anaerolineae bacterium]